MNTTAAEARRVGVTIAGKAAREQVLPADQAEGRACIGCGAAGAELVPVGIAFPPRAAGNGVVRACPRCALGMLGA